MNMMIQKGSIAFLRDCEEALVRSELGRQYFSAEGSAKNAVLEGLGQGNLFVALVDDQCVGFFCLLPKGAFHSFPYLHLIAVKEEYRGQGLGRELLRRIEEMAFGMADKLFLVVADFNPDAKRFYEKNGYHQAGAIPGLYRRGITEFLMIKDSRL